MSGIVDRSLLPNYGRRAGFGVVPVPGGFAVQNTVQLLSVRPARASAWTITLEPCTRQGNPGQVPWLSTFDGTEVVPSAVNFSAPVNSASGYKVNLAWGAGGIRQQAVFDYPMAGGTFSVFADTVDLSVSGIDPTQVYVQESMLPIFGAFMVPGSCAQSAGMRLSDVPQAANTLAGNTVRWAVKPHGRWLWVAQLNGANIADQYTVGFDNVSTLWASLQQEGAGSINTAPNPIPVPPQATFVTLTAGPATVAPGMYWAIMWELFFA